MPAQLTPLGRVRVAVTRLALLTLLLLAAAPAAADAKVRKRPSGLKFYSAPHLQVRGKHGTLIWARKLSGTPAANAWSRAKASR